MWSQLFTKQPNTVFDAYNHTAGALNKLRDQRIVNALNQIKLNYAPQMAQQGADLGAANVSIKQNEAKYAPQMSLADLAQKHSALLTANLQREGMSYENIIKKAEADHAPEKVMNSLYLQRAQIQQYLAKANALTQKAGAPNSKNAPTYYDPKTGAPISAPNQQMSAPGAAPPNAPMPFPTSTPAPQAPNGGQGMMTPAATPMAQTNAPEPPATASEETFPGADTHAPNVLQSVGPTDSRGHPAALYNPHTGERFSILNPTQRTQMQNQLISLRQAIPYIDDLKKYGTVGAIGPTGKNELIPNAWGGVPRGVGAEYDKALAAATEHVMTGSKLQKTDTTAGMVKTILNRQNWESRQDYINRMNKFKKHLEDLNGNTKSSLALNAMSLDKYTSDDEQNYVENQYKDITKSKDSGNGDTVKMISPQGKKFNVPKSEVAEAMKPENGWKMAE